MKPARVTVFAFTMMMIISTFGFGWIDINQPEEEEILEEPIEVQSALVSPGHVVFAQYITSDNCVYCYQYGSPAHHQIKTNMPDEYVYISYQSASFSSQGGGTKDTWVLEN